VNINKVILFIIPILFSGKMFCQSVEVAPYAGYMFSSNLNTLDGEIKIDNGVNYGLIVDARFDNEVIVELMYNRLDTKVQITEELFDTVKSSFDVSIEYFQGGAQFEMETGDFRPFAAFTLGATLFNPANEDINSEWRFSFTFAGGIKYYFIKNVGVRLQWRFLLPVYFGGGALFCGERGCGAVISGNTLLLQYDLTAGLVIVI
jgi:hypothetical protein